MIDDTLTKYDVQVGDWITLTRNIELTTARKYYIEAGEFKVQENIPERRKAGCKMYVEAVEGGCIYGALTPEYEYVGANIDDIDFEIHYRPINDPTRYKRRLL